MTLNIDTFPRCTLAHLPTPIEFAERLTSHLGGPEIWIKRDDSTGLSTGGNKARKPEFLMGDALDQGFKSVATHGATQSNHARQTAAAKLGLECHILLEDRTGVADEDYQSNGNVLLDELHGAQATDAKLGNADLVERSDVRADCGYMSEGYGLPAASTLEAISTVAEQEGILVDPVYSGKGMIGDGVLSREHNVVLVHTGGSVALFGYAHRIDLPAAQAAE